MVGSHQTNVPALEVMFPGIICHHCQLPMRGSFRAADLSSASGKGPTLCSHCQPLMMSLSLYFCLKLFAL